MVRLIPRDAAFYEMFVKDAENLLEAARRLDSMVGAYDRLEERVAEIQALEHQGDVIDTQINQRLERSFITPFDREDIHELTARLDDVVDGIQEVAETFVIYGVERPTAEAKRLAAIVTAQANQLLDAIRRLDGFSGIAAHLLEVHELEHEADGLSRAAIGHLFHDGTDPLEVIKWRDLYTALEETIDAAEDAAEVVERIVAKNA
jgi:hypothetical protein